MGLSRRINLRLDPELTGGLERFGSAHGLALSPAARLLLARALRSEQAGEPDWQALNQGVLAGLLAAEHAVLMVASILPEGERRMRALAERASQAAEERLAVVREEPAAPGTERS